MKFFLILGLMMTVSAFAQSGADAESSSNPESAPTSMNSGTMGSDSAMMNAPASTMMEEERMEDTKTEDTMKKKTNTNDMSTVPTPAPSSSSPNTTTP